MEELQPISRCYKSVFAITLNSSKKVKKDCLASKITKQVDRQGIELHFGRCEKMSCVFISINTDPFLTLSLHDSKLSVMSELPELN